MLLGEGNIYTANISYSHAISIGENMAFRKSPYGRGIMTEEPPTGLDVVTAEDVDMRVNMISKRQTQETLQSRTESKVESRNHRVGKMH